MYTRKEENFSAATVAKKNECEQQKEKEENALALKWRERENPAAVISEFYFHTFSTQIFFSPHSWVNNKFMRVWIMCV